MYIDYVLDCQYAESFLVHIPSGVNYRMAIWLNLVIIATTGTTYLFGSRHAARSRKITRATSSRGEYIYV